MEDRVVELETRVAFQEELLRKLDEIVTAQSAEIHRLGQQLQRLQEQLRGIEPSNIRKPSEETPPPHY